MLSKDKIASIYVSIRFKITVPEQTVYEKGQKLSKPRKRIIKKSFILEENRKKIKDWTFFHTKEEKEVRKILEKSERKKQWTFN